MNWISYSPYQASTYFLKLNKGMIRIRYAFENGRKQNKLFILENDEGWFVIRTDSIGFFRVSDLLTLRKYIEGKIRKDEINLLTVLNTAIWKKYKPRPKQNTHKVAYVKEGVFLVAQPAERYK